MAKDWAAIVAGIERAKQFIEQNAETLGDMFVSIHCDHEFGASIGFSVILSSDQHRLDVIANLFAGQTATVKRGGVPGRAEADYTVCDRTRNLRFDWSVWTMAQPVGAVADLEQVLI